MSPSPTLRATSTSRSVLHRERSRARRPRDGAMPASSSASADRLARERQLGVGEALAERGLADADDRGPVLDQTRTCAGSTSPSTRGRAARGTRPCPRSPSSVRLVQLDEHRLVLEDLRARRPRSRRAAASSPSRSPWSGPLASRSAHSFAAASSSAAGTTLLTMPSARRLGRADQVVAEEDELLRLVHARRGAAAGTATPPSGMRPRRTNTWMMRAVSAAMTRSAASASIAPPPAAVPLSATITGFSQSWIASMRRWNPVRIMLIAGADDHVGRALGLRRASAAGPRRSTPVQKCRSPAPVSTIARTLEVGVRVLEVLR